MMANVIRINDDEDNNEYEARANIFSRRHNYWDVWT